jgi:hypothetical protein
MYTFADQVKKLAAKTAEPLGWYCSRMLSTARAQMIFSRSGDLQNLSMSEILKDIVSFINGKS